MTDSLTKLLEAVERSHAATNPSIGLSDCWSEICRAAAEVLKARGEAVAWWMQRSGEDYFEPGVSHPDDVTGSWTPLYSVPPDTVPREKVERLALYRAHKAGCTSLEPFERQGPCDCGSDAALREFGMEGR